MLFYRMKKFLVSLLFSAFAFAGFATHNMGGDISYKWISGTKYEITVTTFTAVQSLADRCQLTVYFGDGDSAIAPRLNGPQSGMCTATGFDGVLIGNNVKYNIYKITHVFPQNGNYHVTMYDPNQHSG